MNCRWCHAPAPVDYHENCLKQKNMVTLRLIMVKRYGSAKNAYQADPDTWDAAAQGWTAGSKK